MSTLIRIPTRYMRFLPAQRQSDDMMATLPLDNWQVELVLIFNVAVRLGIAYRLYRYRYRYRFYRLYRYNRYANMKIPI